MEALPQDLADFLVTKNFDPEYFDDKGQPAEAGDAKTMKFDYVASTGKNYGTAVVVVADNDLSLFYGDNLGRGMDPDDKQEWFEFLERLSNKAASHSATWSPRDINQLKHTLAGIAAIKEGLFEGYYGNRRVSYMGEQTQARLVINHNRVLGEEDKRFRYVESLFIETADQERFRLPFKSLAGGRAMLEHVRSGGRPYDIRGNHITEIVSEMAVLSRFNRAQHHRVYEGVTQELVESARQYYHNLQETVKHLGSSRGYQAYFETWAPDQTGEAEALVENLRDLFVEQTLDARIEAALPTLAKIQQQGNNMKEAKIFENWINNLSEGTWALPETPEQQEKLNQLMAGELIVGPDAVNATEQLYNLVGDDELFDILNDLADKSQGRANCWDDSDVQRRLAELGVQTPQSTQAEPSDVEQDTAPVVKEQDMAEALDPEKKQRLKDLIDQYRDATDPEEYPGDDEDEYLSAEEVIAQIRQEFGDKTADSVEQGPSMHYPRPFHKMGYDPMQWKVRPRITKSGVLNKQDVGSMKRDIKQRLQHDMTEGDNTATFVEDAELARMLKHAGVPVNEGVLTDSTGHTLEHIKDTFRRDVKDFEQTGDMSDHLFHALYDYYFDDMPYGTKKGRDGDPHEWVSDRFAQDIGMNENLVTKMIEPVSECNYTMEGEYCPAHGLAECGGMYEGDPNSLTGLAGQAVGYVTPNPSDAVAGFKKQFEDNEIVQNTRKLTDGWKGAVAGGAAGAMAGDLAGGALGSKIGQALGGAVGAAGGPIGSAAGQIAGNMAGEKIGQFVGGALGGAAGGVAGDKLGGKEETDEDSTTSKIVKSAAQAATQGLGDAVGGSGKEIAKNMLALESNTAMTGSYYEGQETPTQEGDALLARIKSLALLR